MKRNLLLASIVLACAAVLVSGVVAQEIQEISVTVLGEDGTVVDLTELRDGETRTFGEGERELAATREGDEVHLRRGPLGDDEALSFTCNLSTDSCQVITHEGDERVMVRVERKLECVNGHGDCDLHDMDIMALGDLGGEGKKVIVKKIVDCDGDDCAHKEIKMLHGRGHEARADVHWVGEIEGEPQHMVFIAEGDGDPHVMHIGTDKVQLHCPEGDASLWVDKNEAEDTFLCPKHSQPMKKATKGHVRKILIESATDED